MRAFAAALALCAVVGSSAMAQDADADLARFTERSCGAATVQEGVTCLAETLPPATMAELVGLSYAELALSHWGLGMYIRNEWGFWDGRTPLVHAFRDAGYRHPDDMSAALIQGVWLSHHGCAADFEAMVQWRGASVAAAEAAEPPPPAPAMTCPAAEPIP